MKLRPHHGLCLHFFRGEGYSDTFVSNMTKIMDKLGENPSIELISAGDALCITCPNRTADNGCTTDEKVLRYDNAVLALCHLSAGDRLPWLDFKAAVERNILSEHRLCAVCPDCQWRDICHNT